MASLPKIGCPQRYYYRFEDKDIEPAFYQDFEHAPSLIEYAKWLFEHVGVDVLVYESKSLIPLEYEDSYRVGSYMNDIVGPKWIVADSEIALNELMPFPYGFFALTFVAMNGEISEQATFAYVCPDIEDIHQPYQYGNA